MQKKFKNEYGLMTSNSTDSIPNLAPPGAGLPFFQRLYLRLWLGPVVSKRTPRSEIRKGYEIITKKIIELAQAVSPEFRNHKVLVEPIFGLEDSSRFWSMNELIEHLLIVLSKIQAAILSLSAGKIPDEKIDIVKVKPHNPNQDRLQEFIDLAPELLARLDEQLAQPGMNIKSTLRYLHPWLGPLIAYQWYWFLRAHQYVHYQQAKQIAASLKKSKI